MLYSKARSVSKSGPSSRVTVSVERCEKLPRKQVCGGVALGPNVKVFSRFLGVRALLRGLVVGLAPKSPC